jgi:hypothetical protein
MVNGSMRAPSLLARHHQSSALDHLAERARRRPHPARLIPLQNPLQLPRSPAHVRLPQLQHRPLHHLGGLVGMRAWRPGQFHQTSRSLLTITPQPHIAGLARDPMAAAQFPHRLLIALILKDKAQLLLHHTARFPGHNSVLKPAARLVQCHLCPRFNMSAM